jgi:ADP-L-glycero-D-manno-heptose 6-epimerase
MQALVGRPGRAGQGKNAKTSAMSKWVVTGGAGFIGSAIVWKLNEEGLSDILVVDVPEHPEKRKNLQHRRYADYMDAYEFKDQLLAGKLPKIDGIIHMGACSSTTEMDVDYLRRNNTEYTKSLAKWALDKKKPFIYASSAATYGNGELGYSTDEAVTPKLKPLNPYGDSKQQFDLWAMQEGVLDQLIGIKFFNIFGPNEYHKGDMRSVVAKAYDQIRQDGKIRLFKSYRSDYKDGEQVRDFLYVKDAVAVVYEFMQGKGYGGLYNLGVGQARTWNDLAKAIFAALGKPPKIEYIEMPESLREKYQYHTQADMGWMKNKRKIPKFRSLEEGVRDYVQNYLSKEDPYL